MKLKYCNNHIDEFRCDLTKTLDTAIGIIPDKQQEQYHYIWASSDMLEEKQIGIEIHTNNHNHDIITGCIKFNTENIITDIILDQNFAAYNNQSYIQKRIQSFIGEKIKMPTTLQTLMQKIKIKFATKFKPELEPCNIYYTTNMKNLLSHS